MSQTEDNSQWIEIISEKSGRRSFLGSLFKKSSSASANPGSYDDSPAVPDPPAATAAKVKDEKQVKVKKNTTNAMVVHLSALAEEPAAAGGDPWYCRGCRAVVSTLSKLSKAGETVSWKW